MNVLVADDWRDIADMLDLMLSLEGHKVSVRTFAFSALLTPGPWEGVDVAVLDYNLGEECVTGEDICCYLKQNFPHVKRIVLTGDQTVPNSVHRLVECADVVLLKPCSADELLSAVKK